MNPVYQNTLSHYLNQSALTNLVPLICEYAIGISNEELAEIREVYERCVKDWEERAGSKPIYLSTIETRLTYSLHFFKRDMVLIDTEYFESAGNTLRANLCYELHSNCRYVVLSAICGAKIPHLESVVRDFSKWNGKRGLAPPFAHQHVPELERELFKAIRWIYILILDRNT